MNFNGNVTDRFEGVLEGCTPYIAGTSGGKATIGLLGNGRYQLFTSRYSFGIPAAVLVTCDDKMLSLPFVNLTAKRLQTLVRWSSM